MNCFVRRTAVLRSVGQAVCTPTHSFARFFSSTELNRPETWEALFTHNDVVLYDRVSDPDELVNLAHAYYRDRHRELILELNAKLNALLDAEGAAEEDGAHSLSSWLPLGSALAQP